jgi:hypothetical protein
VGAVRGKTLLHLQCHFIDTLSWAAFSEWGMGFTVEGPDGTWVTPDSVEGELPLSYSMRARKPG